MEAGKASSIVSQDLEDSVMSSSVLTKAAAFVVAVVG